MPQEWRSELRGLLHRSVSIDIYHSSQNPLACPDFMAADPLWIGERGHQKGGVFAVHSTWVESVGAPCDSALHTRRGKEILRPHARQAEPFHLFYPLTANLRHAHQVGDSGEQGQGGLPSSRPVSLSVGRNFAAFVSRLRSDWLRSVCSRSPRQSFSLLLRQREVVSFHAVMKTTNLLAPVFFQSVVCAPFVTIKVWSNLLPILFFISALLLCCHAHRLADYKIGLK